MALTKIKPSLAIHPTSYSLATFSGAAATYNLTNGSNFIHTSGPPAAWDVTLTNVPTSVDGAGYYTVKVKIIHFMNSTGYVPATLVVNGASVSMSTLNSNLITGVYALSEITILMNSGTVVSAQCYNTRMGAV